MLIFCDNIRWRPERFMMVPHSAGVMGSAADAIMDEQISQHRMIVTFVGMLWEIRMVNSPFLGWAHGKHGSD